MPTEEKNSQGKKVGFLLKTATLEASAVSPAKEFQTLVIDKNLFCDRFAATREK